MDAQRWDNAPADKQERYIAGVNFETETPPATLEEGHNFWLGLLPDDHLEKNIAWDQLEDPDKAERAIFAAVVAACNEVQPTVTIVKDTGNNEIPTEPVKYIGHRDSYRDGVYGTNITWQKGETILVQGSKAHLMFRHKDVWVMGDKSDAKLPEVDPLAADKEQRAEEDKIQDARDKLARLDKKSMAKFAIHNFPGQKFPKNIGVEKMREQLDKMIDQFGLI
jgi:hypothetical protein